MMTTDYLGLGLPSVHLLNSRLARTAEPASGHESRYDRGTSAG